MRVAFITGASSGLGRGMALRLARDGYAVAVAARRGDALETLVAEIESQGGRALALQLDVTDRSATTRAVARCTAELGPVDLLIANAGMSIQTDARALSSEAVEQVMQVNFFGAVYAVEAVLPAMLERNAGQLVAVGSLAGYNGLPLTGAYSASKGALHNFFESVRLDLRGTGVDVTFITPGYVKSPMTDQNDHAMPFLQETDTAVNGMVEAIYRRVGLYTFPAPLAGLVWLAQVFPTGLYDAVASRVRRAKKE